MTELSPVASAIWEAFNQDEAGVFVDYGDKLAAALRAAADQVVPAENTKAKMFIWQRERLEQRLIIRQKLLTIANELEAQ